MKIKVILIILLIFFISSCADDVTKHTYHFATASGYLNSINSISADGNNAVCIDVNNKHVLDLQYKMVSNGLYGDNPDADKKNSYLKVVSGRLYVDGVALVVDAVDDRVLYYNTTIDDMVGIVDIRGIEQSGSGTPTGDAETFGAVFGNVKFDSTGPNCNF